MPKMILTEHARKNEELRRMIRGGLERQGKSRKEFTRRSGIAESTYYERLQHLGALRLDELRALHEMGVLSGEDILNII